MEIQKFPSRVSLLPRFASETIFPKDPRILCRNKLIDFSAVVNSIEEGRYMY